MALAFDPQGRITIAPENAGLLRLTLNPEDGEPKVEVLISVIEEPATGLYYLSQEGVRFRPDLVGDPVLSSPTPERWINQDAFAQPQQFTFGSAGRNVLRRDGINNIDLLIFKMFRTKEGITLEDRAEA